MSIPYTAADALGRDSYRQGDYMPNLVIPEPAPTESEAIRDAALLRAEIDRELVNGYRDAVAFLRSLSAQRGVFEADVDEAIRHVGAVFCKALQRS